MVESTRNIGKTLGWNIPRDFYKEPARRGMKCPLPFSGESFISWLTRFSISNCSDVKEFVQHLLEDHDVKIECLETNREKRELLIERLLPMLKIDEFYTFDDCLSFNRETIFTTILESPRYCPLCLEEDHIPHFPLKWHLPFYLVCDKHHVILHDCCPNCSAKIKYWNSKWNDGFATCHECNKFLWDDQLFITRLQKPSMLKIQSAMMEVFSSSQLNGENVNINTFFNHAWNLTSRGLDTSLGLTRVINASVLFKKLFLSLAQIINEKKKGDRIEIVMRDGIKMPEPSFPGGLIPDEKLEDMSEKHMDVAGMRYRIIKPYFIAGMSTSEIERTCNESGISKRTFYRWVTGYKKHGIRGLVPHYRKSGRKKGFSKEMEELMAKCILGNLSHSNPLSLTSCWRTFVDRSKNLSITGKIPCRETFRNRYNALSKRERPMDT